MHVRLILCIALCNLTVDSARADAKPKPIWLVVTRPMFVDAIRPLVDRRRNEGFDARLSTKSIARAIDDLPRRPRYVLLVGDEAANADGAAWRLPSQHRDLYRWREVQRMQFASDALHADRNHDLIPDFPVGRIPARSVAEVDVVVRKIIAFEERTPTIHDLDLPVWAGAPLYGDAIDDMANGLLLATIQSKSPDWIQPWVVMGDSKRAFCGWPLDQPAKFLGRMRGGGLLHVFIGHGKPDSILSMIHGQHGIGLSTKLSFGVLKDGPPTAPMILLTCDAGYFDGEAPCLAEALLFLPGGPVATIAASTESHPLPNYFTGQHLLATLNGKHRRIGDIWLTAQRRALTARDYLIEPVLRDVEGKLEPDIDVSQLRRDQMLMYNLLGDPATPLAMPRPLNVTIEKKDGSWRWRVQRPNTTSTLHVGLRRAPIELPAPATLPDNRDQANAALETANTCFAFETLNAFSADQAWEGVIDRPGAIRFVAVGGDRLFVHVAELRTDSP